ncbi:MAG: sulfotransferase [Rhodobacteraceae bacterium HLUCCA08]|nr:MAG: sulfotransferase [Rhodobacteraceae bacterium HLUCCA08]
MSRFDYFVVFAEMRTGSNFLEANINAFDGLTCHGEAFNPHFISYPDRAETLGVTQAQRDADPSRLIAALCVAPGLNGFRFFNDHDARVLDIALPDPRCAKIVLTRNPVESYVSWKIARATGQWKLTNVKHQKSSKIQFDAAEFTEHVDRLQAFQVLLLNQLQRSGQTAFHVAYEDLQDVAVMNGLAAFLGCDARLEALDRSLKKQNPAPLSDKVANFAEMEQALAALDRFNLTRTPNFEPRRGAAVPSFVAAADSPLIYMPLRGGPEAAVTAWLAALDDAAPTALQTGFTQKTLRQWKRRHPGHRGFTVIRHPVARAHAAFCDKILSTGEGSYAEIRQTLRREWKLPIPGGAPDADYGPQAHRAAFLAWMGFVKANLAGNTAIRVDPYWATQTQVIQGFADFALPDMILREDDLAEELAILAAKAGKTVMPQVPEVTDPHAARLRDIYDSEVEDAVRQVYQRDYMSFGFGAYAA